MHTVGEILPESGSNIDVGKTFSHSGIIFHETKLTLELSEDARIALGELITAIQSSFSKEEANDDKVVPSDITEAVVQNVLDGMIDKHKRNKQLNGLLERIREIKNRRKPKPKVVENVEKKIRKYSSGEYQHVFIEYTESNEVKRIPIPLIIRPDDTVKSVLDSMTVRLRFLKIT